MKILYYFIFFIILSCASNFSKSEKVYICGDHPCKNKKEAEEYFSNNISIEVYTISSDKNQKKDFDLVELNLIEDKLKTKDKVEIIRSQKDNLKKQIKERKRLAKLKIKKVETQEKKEKLVKSKVNTIKKTIPKKRKPKQYTFIRICKNLEECDIDKIEKIVMDIGKQKKFPDITN